MALIDGLSGTRWNIPDDSVNKSYVGSEYDEDEVILIDSLNSVFETVMPILAISIVVMNSIILISNALIIKKGIQPKTTYLFMGNLSLTDFLAGIAVLFGLYAPAKWRTHTFCCFQMGLIVSTIMASVYCIGLIAIDRFLYILHGLQYQQWIYTNRAKLLIVVTWTLALIIGFMPLMGWSGDTMSGKSCVFIKVAPSNLIILTCVLGIIPLITIIGLYSIILYHSIRRVMYLKRATRNKSDTADTSPKKPRIYFGKSTTNLQETPLNKPSKKSFSQILFPKKNDRVKSPSRWKAIKVVALTTGCFAITWVPYFVTVGVWLTCDKEGTPKKCRNIFVLISIPLSILAFSNSFLNPFIYAWWHKGFRSFFKTTIFKKCSKSLDLRNSSSSTFNTKQNAGPGGNNGNRELYRETKSTGDSSTRPSSYAADVPKNINETNGSTPRSDINEIANVHI